MSPSFSDKSLVYRPCDPYTLCGISSRFQLLSPSEGQVAHALLTRPPLSHPILLSENSILGASFDLHVLGTPPAFILSQDQTLNKWYLNCFTADKISLSNAYSSYSIRIYFVPHTSFNVCGALFLVLICISEHKCLLKHFCSYIV